MIKYFEIVGRVYVGDTTDTPDKQREKIIRALHKRIPRGYTLECKLVPDTMRAKSGRPKRS